MAATYYDNRRRLSDVLRQWRSRTDPENVGIRRLPRGRSPGLRREDVAVLAGISLTWYARFEAGKQVRVSPALLERIAEALRLTPAESVELFALALPEFGRTVDVLLRQVESGSRLELLAEKLAVAGTAAEADALAIRALPEIDAAGHGAHVASLDSNGMLTFTQARGPQADTLQALGAIPFGDFPSDVHIVEDATTLDEAGAHFYDSVGLRSSLCMCVRRTADESLWIGYTGSEPHVFVETEISELKAVSTLLGLLHHAREELA